VIDLLRTSRGRVAVDDRALDRLVREAAERVDGVEAVHARRGVRIAVEPEREVVVAIGIVARTGVVLPDVARGVQAGIGEVVETVLEPRSLRVDVAIEEVAG
jgi:uncharacterized alkaline shock family protein YloU